MVIESQNEYGPCFILNHLRVRNYSFSCQNLLSFVIIFNNCNWPLQVSDDNALPELCAPIAGVVLTLVCHLRQCFLTESDGSNPADGRLSHYLSLLDGTAPVNQSAAFDQPSGSRTLFSSSLQVVLKGLIEHILRSSEWVVFCCVGGLVNRFIGLTGSGQLNQLSIETMNVKRSG